MTRRILLLTVPLLTLLLLAVPGRGEEDRQRDDQKAAAGKARGRALNLTELWQLAQRRFPGLQAAEHAITSARHTVDEQKWLRLPSGELTVFLTGSPSIQCQGTVLSADGKTPLFESNADQCLHTNANLNLLDSNIGQVLPVHGALLRIDARIIQPLYTFGKLDAARDLAQVGVELAQAAAASTRGDLALNVLRAYYGLKTVRASLDMVREGRDQLLGWIKRIDKDLEKGKAGASEIDLMRLKVSDSQVENAVLDLERTMKSTLAAVRYLVQDPAADIDDDELVVAEGESHDLNYYLDQAFLHRPEKKQLDATGQGARLYRKLRIAELLPDFGIVASLNYGLATSVEDPNNAFMNRLNYLGAAIGLTMRVNLDFGPRVARLRKAQADILQYEARRKELLGGGAVEIERSFNDLEEARKRLVAARTGERRARGWLHGIQQNIDVGTAEPRDMIESLRTYFDQRIQVLRAINDVNVTAATLRRQCGLDIIPG